MAFSSEQLYLLNTLSYLSVEEVCRIKKSPEATRVEDVVETILSSKSLQQNLANDFQSQNEIVSVMKRIKADPGLMKLQFSHVSYSEGGATRLVLTTPPEATTQEAIVVMEGTVGGREWRDNARGGARTDQADGVSTQVQVETQNWYKSNEIQSILNRCDHITVTGHSKGGNKAKYLALLNDDIDACVSFDGQGFSEEFLEKYKDAIERRQDIIVNYNNADDYVNILLNDIGARHYIQGTKEEDFLRNHSLFTLAQVNNLTAAETDQNPVMAELDRIINGYLRTLNAKEKQLFMKILGELLADALGQDPANYVEYAQWLLGEKGLGLFTDFLAYTAASITLKGVYDFLARITEPWKPLHDYIVMIAQKWDDQRSDISYAGEASGAKCIAIDTETLERLASQLAHVADELQSLANRLNACAEECDSFHIGFQISIGLRLRLAGVVSGLCIGTPGNVLQHIRKNVSKLRTTVDGLSRSTHRAATTFEEMEQRNINKVPAGIGQRSIFS